ncbi:MAG: trypsin-like peptidase domain-containing protein, partial [Rhodothermales bacterium]|nr:trypsin-like peptidase domain-containing protein [Rhodothermales bacterium]
MPSARLAVLLAALLLPIAAAAQPVPFDFTPATPGARLTADTYVPTALACSINSACPEGEGADAAVRATVQVIDGGACSGVLLNNTRQDRTPYILTAYHCFPAAVGDTVQWDVRFGYQSPTCANPSEPPAYQTVTGGVVRAAQYGFADFVLVELTTPVPEEVYFAGWSIEDAVPQRGLAVGHPRGDLQKLTLDDDPLKTSPFTAAYWLAHYDHGVMEPGSSGAPLFNEALQMIGHVKGAYALMGSCGGPDGDDNYPLIYHPKLSYVWTHGVAPFLDPDGTGRTAMPALPPPPPVWISEINAGAHPADPGAGEFVELAGRPGAALDDLVLDVYDCRAGQAELRASEALKPYTFRDEGDSVGRFVLGGTALDRTVRDQRLGRRPKREAGKDGYLPDHQGILVLRHRDGTPHFDYRYGAASATD